MLLYLDSIERTILEETLFPGLTPNLSALAEDALSLTGISQLCGTG